MPGGVQRAAPQGRIGLRIGLLASCLLALGGCERRDDGKRPPQPGDVAVAAVNDQTVWASDVKREAVAEGLIGDGEALDTNSVLFDRAMDEVVDQKLLAGEALKRGVDGDLLAKRRLAAARERALSDMLVESVVDQAVNDAAIRRLYAEQLKVAKPTPEYHLRQILLTSQAEADAAKKQLAAGASFETLAMERSTDSLTRFSGGDLSYLSAEAMPGAYSAAVTSAKSGDVVGPLQTDAGWVLLKVEDQRPQAPITLDQARAQIVRFLTYDQVRDLLERLRSQSKVKLMISPSGDGLTSREQPLAAPLTPTKTLLGPSTAVALLQEPFGAAHSTLKPVQPKTTP